MIRLQTPAAATDQYTAVIDEDESLRIAVTDDAGRTETHALDEHSQVAWTLVHDALARAFGLRRPLACLPPPPERDQPPLTPILTAPVDPRLWYGYGDPCVVRVGPADYRMLVTSNDAPDAFPILRSHDLLTWTFQSFVFPQGATPAWCLTGENAADFWAPELHQVQDAWLLCFTARRKDGELAIGLARAVSPNGPFVADEAPILAGGVIDSHILVDAEGGAWLVWKKDDNAVWPRALAAMLHRAPQLVETLFDTQEDRRTASLILTLWPWIETRPPMEQFFILQPLIEAGAHDLADFVRRVRALAEPEAREIAEALHTRIFAQQLSPDGRTLLGEPVAILQNDLLWEGHLIEGVWITQEGGRYYLLYAGNDFSTAHYGIGVAVADTPTGPYRKGAEAFLSSSGEWWGPGHPSVVRDDTGRARIFLHAFPPGATGYKRFRALLSAHIRFRDGEVRIEA